MLKIWQAKPNNRNEKDTPTEVLFVCLHFSTTQISFKFFQSCQTKVTFAAKFSNFALHSDVPVFEHIFHMLNLV